MKKMYNRVMLALMALMFTSFSWAQTTVPSIISSNQTWDAAGSPYMVNTNTLVEEGVTVTVMPGTTIESPNEKIRIIVNGEFNAQGKKDSAIVINLTSFDFSKSSVDYDSATGTGSQFRYCLFNGNGASAGNKTINLNETGILVRNCKFTDGYYNIYVYNYWEVKPVYIEKSIFLGIKSQYGYPVYSSGSNGMLYLTDCYLEKMGAIYLGAYSSVERCTFRNFQYSRGIGKTNNCKYLNLECNLFQNFKYSIVDVSYMANGSFLNVQYNTFDSADVFIEGSYITYNKPATMVISNNNFLTFRKNAVTYGGSSTPGKADTINFQNNYWGTTTTSTISAGIKDFDDDITIGVYVDFTNMRTSKVTTCSGGSVIGDADTSSSQGHVSIKPATSSGLNIYPNPASNKLTIDLDGKQISAITIFDITGKLVFANNQNPNNSIDVGHLQNGTYIIEVAYDGTVLRKKFSVSH